MKDNKLIAEFMGLPLVPCSIGTEHGIVTEGYKHPKVDVPVIPSGMQYHTSWDWLMPVVQKIEDYLSDNVGEVGYFDDGLTSNDIEVRYQAVVEFIKEYNDGCHQTYNLAERVSKLIDEHKKYICESCGDHVNEVVFNEDTDVDECKNCTL